MRCQLYLMADGAKPIRLGPFEAADDAGARALALAEMKRRPQVRSIDIWCDSGELFRVDRPADPAPPNPAWMPPAVEQQRRL